MKRIFTILAGILFAMVSFAQVSPWYTEGEGYAISFCSDVDISDTAYIITDDNAILTLENGALKFEAEGGAMIKFKLSVDLSTVLDLSDTTKRTFSFDYKNASDNIGEFLVGLYANYEPKDNWYGKWVGEVNIADSYVANSSDWTTVSGTFDSEVYEAWSNIDLFEIGGFPMVDEEVVSFMIDNVKFGNVEFEICSTTSIGATFTSNKSLSVYPNPATSSIMLDVDAENVVIYNSVGQELKSVSNYQKRSSIDISSLTNGIYFVKANDKTQKVIIE